MNEIERLKKEIDKLRKDKIISMAKLKQKEDKITDLTKKVREIAITSKESGGSKDLEEKVKDLEVELKRSRKINNDLRNDNATLTKNLEEARKATKVKPAIESTSKLEKVSLPGSTTPKSEQSPVDSEEFEYLQSQISKKDETIARLTDQIEMMTPENLSQIGSSYMQTRKLNARIRELKSLVELSKKSEASMKERLMDMQRQLALKDEDMSW